MPRANDEPNLKPTYAIDPSPPPNVSAQCLRTPFSQAPVKQSDGKTPVDLNKFAGEYRGVYENCTWIPSFSKFGAGVRNGKDHDGVDLFAASGTPVQAVHDGNAIYYDDDGSEFGNRISVWFKIGADVWFFLYGHLQPFTPQERAKSGPVKKGVELGRVGCSGTYASYNCTKVVCKFGGRDLASSHLHIAFVRETPKAAFDIVKATGWNIDTPAKP
jgi:murein DD-endopeptidase MepM/ murein hydrolase activator NlpD